MKNQKFFLELNRAFSIIVMVLVLNTTIAFAAENAEATRAALADTGNGTAVPAGTGTPAGITPEIKDTVQTAEFACKNPSTNFYETVLKPEEVAMLKTGIQNLETPNGKVFTGKEREAPDADAKKIPLKDREKLENPNVVVPTGVGREAALATMPQYKFSPAEAPFNFNKEWLGPFAVGVSLDDTLRVGRCEGIQSQIENNSCPLTDKRLELRNSGEGITQDFKNVWTDLKDWIGVGEDMTENYTDAQTEQMRTQMAADTDKQATYKEVKRLEGPIIQNSIKAQSFSANIGSNCTTSACSIGAYSAFDKYFNSWFSADLVINNFGPTLFGQAKRYLGTLGRRGWPWDMSNNAFYKEFRKKFLAPGTLLSDAKTKAMQYRTDKYGFGEFRKAWWEGTGEWDGGYTAVKGGGARKMLDEWLKEGGKLDEIKDPVRRGEFFKLVQDWRSTAKTFGALTDDAASQYTSVIGKYGMNSAEGRAALIGLAQKNSKLMRDLDSITQLDFPEYWVKQDIVGLYNVAVKEAKTGQFVALNSDSHYITSIMMKFEEDGHWANWDEFASRGGGAGPSRLFEATPEGFLKVYKPDPAGNLIDTVAFEDLQKNFSRFRDKMTILEDGTPVKIDDITMPLIAEKAGTGNIKVYDLGWKAETLTPEDFAARFTRSRVQGRLSRQFTIHTDRLYNALVEKGWAGQNRRYLSLLDKAASQEEEILKSYFSIKGGAKWTIVPYIYWGLKRGVGVEGLSAYQLPDSWRQAELSLGETTLYNDSFVDFFANEGSDEGDIFSQVLNILPWKMVLNKVSDEYGPVKDQYDKITGRGGPSGYRSNVENLALFSQTGDDCKTCSWAFTPMGINMQTGIGPASMHFSTRGGLSNILLEDVITDNAKESGSTIIAFAHHTNIDWSGPEKSEQDTTLDLVQAQKDKKTCKDALDNAPVIGWFGPLFNGKPQRAGAALAFGESMLYFAFGWPGIFGSVAQQVLIAPEFADCIDDLEGYYIHLFAPAKEAQKKTETPNQVASEKGAEIFKNLSNTITGPANADDKSKTFVDVVKDKIREESQKISEKAEAKAIVQAKVETQNFTTGGFSGKQFFFLWFKGESNPSKYDTVSKVVDKDKDSGIDVLFDNEKGTIEINGKPVITSPDHARLAAPNGNVPAEAIPQRITKIVLPVGSEELIFQMGINSELSTADTPLGNQILNCIKQGVLEQTGVPLNSSNLSDAFGKVKAIVSDTHPQIVADELTKTITAEGTPREIVYGDTALALVNASRVVELLGGSSGKGSAKVGKMDSIQFENGVIVFKPSTNELIIWLKRHDKAILNQNDVEGLIAIPTTYKNPITNCDEPAINLEAVPKSGSDAISARVDNFNASMEKMGPFQVFDTDTYRFIFYEKLENGVCVPYFKSINKKTGDIYDQPIQGNIEKTPTGIKFTTAHV